jgi:hypothetical protein
MLRSPKGCMDVVLSLALGGEANAMLMVCGVVCAKRADAVRFISQPPFLYSYKCLAALFAGRITWGIAMVDFSLAPRKGYWED